MRVEAVRFEGEGYGKPGHYQIARFGPDGLNAWYAGAVRGWLLPRKPNVRFYGRYRRAETAATAVAYLQSLEMVRTALSA